MKKTAIQQNIERLNEELKIYTHKLFNCQEELIEAYKCKIHCIECELVINRNLLEFEKNEMIDFAMNLFHDQNFEKSRGILEVIFDSTYANN